MNNQSNMKMQQNIQASKYGSAHHSRQSSVAKQDQSLDRSLIAAGHDISTAISKGPSH